MRELSLFLLLSLLFSLLACTRDRAPATMVEAMETEGMPLAADGPVFHCFRQEFLFPDAPDPAAKDVINLEMVIEDGELMGIYNWLPYDKDKRVGTISGDVVATDTLSLYYSFKQEGKMNTVPLTAILQEEGIIISGGSPELGLSAEIPRVPCELED